MTKTGKVLKYLLIGTAVVFVPVMLGCFYSIKTVRRKSAKSSIIDSFNEFSNKEIDIITSEKLKVELDKLTDNEMVCLANYIKQKQFGDKDILNTDTNKIQSRFDKRFFGIKEKKDLFGMFKEYGIKGF